MDTAANQVVVTVTPQAKGAPLAALLATTKRYGTAVRVVRESTTFSKLHHRRRRHLRRQLPLLARLQRPQQRSTYYFLTAGHCTNIGEHLVRHGSRTMTLGTRAGTSFPGNDYGIVRYSTSYHQPPGHGGQPGHHQRRAPRRSASRSPGAAAPPAPARGTVTALNPTVNYAQGSVFGMIRTTVCAQPGDSGGSLYRGTTALGLTSGGSGNCTSGGTTFFQPVTEPLSVYGVSVY